MIQEPETLYKLMILYLMNNVSFSLTNSQISHFLLDRDYTTYFTLQSVLSELVDSNLITSRKLGNSTYYDITNDGREALTFFSSEISDSTIQDMDEYLRENKFSLRSESSSTAEYFKTDYDSYDVRFMAMEGKKILLSIDVIVPDESVAKQMCANWKGLSQKIYSYLMLTLTNKNNTPM